MNARIYNYVIHPNLRVPAEHEHTVTAALAVQALVAQAQIARPTSFQRPWRIRIVP